MKKFNLSAKITISLYTSIEAETIEEAIEIAKERETMQIINDCSYNEDSVWMASDMDGEPYDIKDADI